MARRKAATKKAFNFWTFLRSGLSKEMLLTGMFKGQGEMVCCICGNKTTVKRASLYTGASEGVDTQDSFIEFVDRLEQKDFSYICDVCNPEIKDVSRTKRCSLYWIRRPEHTDILRQGYIGISIKQESRLMTHLWEANTGRKKVKEFGDCLSSGNFIIETLVIGTQDYCLDLEFKLRPFWRIGWNVEPGGGCAKAGREGKHNFNGVMYTTNDLAILFDIKPNTLTYRLLRGETLEEALRLVEKQKPSVIINGMSVRYTGTLTQEQITEIERLKKEGLNCNQISGKMGLPPRPIYSIVEKGGL